MRRRETLNGLFRHTRREMLAMGLRGWTPTKGKCAKRWSSWQRVDDVPKHIRAAIQLAIAAAPSPRDDRVKLALQNLAEQAFEEFKYKLRVVYAAEAVHMVEPSMPLVALFHAAGLELGQAQSTGRNQYYDSVKLTMKGAADGREDKSA